MRGPTIHGRGRIWTALRVGVTNLQVTFDFSWRHLMNTKLMRWLWYKYIRGQWQCQNHLMTIHNMYHSISLINLNSRHLTCITGLPKHKLKSDNTTEVLRPMWSLYFHSKQTDTKLRMRRNIFDLMFLSPAWQHNRARIIIRTYPLLWNCLLPVKLMTGICTATGGTQYNCNLPPTVSRRGRGHGENKWRGDKACH